MFKKTQKIYYIPDKAESLWYCNYKELFHVYEKSMQGLNYEQTLANVNHFLETKNKLNVPKPKVDVTMVRTKWIESKITTIRNYWREKILNGNTEGLLCHSCFKQLRD